MQILGNILLIIAALSAVGLFNMTFLQRMPGGDMGVGYAWGLLMLTFVFWVCMALVACIIGYSGGFAWLSMVRYTGGGMLVAYFLILVLGSNLGMDPSMKGIRMIAPANAVVTSLVLMAAFAVLLNDNLRMIISPTLVKWGLGTILAVNTLMLATIIFGAIVSKVSVMIPRPSDELDDFELGMLDYVEKHDVSKGITSLFSYAGENKPPQIRETAVLKIKSKPDWQDDLFKALQGDYVDDAFGFLLANEVDDKKRFAEGVNQGILSQARLIREGLRRIWNQQTINDDFHGFEVRRLIKVVDKFKDQGVDFTPAMKELRAAYDVRLEFAEPNFNGKRAIDKWLKNH